MEDRVPDSIIFSFLTLCKIFKLRIWNPFEWLHLAGREGGKIYTSYFQRRQQYMCYVKLVFWKFFKNFTKLLTSWFLVMLQIFFNQRALKRHSKGNWAFKALGTWRPLGHSNSKGSQGLFPADSVNS